jgi:hypothetical protein
MAKKLDWDYALRIKGTSLDTLPIAVLAEYLKEFAALIGEGARPVLNGIVRGSVIVRVRQAGEHPAYTRNRLQQAANDPLGPGGRSYTRISDLMAKNGARGDIIDRQENTVVAFPGIAESSIAEPDLIIFDTGTLDGHVVGVSGADDTVHLRLQDQGGVEHKVTLRDITMARTLAARFRAGPVRVYVHGTWKRSPDGKWEAHQVYADQVEDLDESTAKEVFDTLRSIKTGWTDVEDPLRELAEIRGGADDLRS